MSRQVIGVLGLALAVAAAVASSDARQAPSGPKGTPPPSPSSTAPDSAASATAAETYNPLAAEKDVEVATYYMRKGDPDASIPRLEEAIQLLPGYAKPRLLLAEIYEKKHDNENALKYYKEYLEVLPHAPDAKKIAQKISKLSTP